MQITSINTYHSLALPKTSNSRSPNFQGASGLLIGLVARQGIGAVNATKSAKYLKELKRALSFQPDYIKYIEGVRALVKTPDVFYDRDHEGWLYCILGCEFPTVPGMRYNVLENMTDVPDSSYYNVQLKKDFFNSLLDNGWELNRDILSQFKNLNDGLYKSFKEEFVDKCFFSEKYNKSRKLKFNAGEIRPTDYACSCRPFLLEHFTSSYLSYSAMSLRKEAFLEQIYNNLKLVSTLDKDTYAQFISRRRGIINQSKKALEDHFNAIRTSAHSSEFPKNLYQDYETNIKPI